MPWSSRWLRVLPLLLALTVRPAMAFERQLEPLVLVPASLAADQVHLPDALAPWLLAVAARSPTAAGIYRAVAAGPCYVYFAPRAHDPRFRAEVEISGLDDGSGRLVARVFYDEEVERRARAGARPRTEDLAVIFHELFHVQELGALAGAADAAAGIGHLAKVLVRQGSARRSGSGRIETPAAVAATQAILRELAAADNAGR